MRLIADEHISFRIVNAISDLARLPTGWSFEAVKRSKYASIEDEDWLEQFANDGGKGLISADKSMLKRPTLVRAISDTGLVAIYLPGEFGEGGHKGYGGKGRLYQMAYAAYWWTEFQAVFGRASEGTAWRAPRRLHIGECQQIDLSSEKSILAAARA